MGVGLLWSPTPSATAYAPVPAKNGSPLEVLNKTHKFDKIDDRQLTLANFVEFLATKLDIEIDIDEEAFGEDGQAAVDLVPVAERDIPAMKNATAAQYLRKVLQRVPSNSGATFLVRKNRVEITTFAKVRAKIWGADHPGPYYPLVNAAFEKKPLSEIAKELADEHEVSIVIDARVGDKAKTELTAKFSNTPLDTALKLLADQSDLQTLAIDNVIYVTTAERAAILKARRDKERKSDDPDNPTEGKRVAPGAGGYIPPMLTGM